MTGNTKLIFSTPVVYLSRFVKKIHLDGFFGGLIFGAIFSLMVNVVTVQIQETIQKQRILEAVEYEILNNTLLAKDTYERNKNIIERKDKPNFFHAYYRYSNDLWTQSTEPLQYISQLEPEIQSKIVVYYTSIIDYINNMVGKYEDIAKMKLNDCYLATDLSDYEQKECNDWNEVILNWESENGKKMADYGFEVLDIFHPTQDRLNNRFLKFFMGDKSIKVLSRE